MLTVNFHLLSIAAGDRVLDVGCGEGRHLIHACIDYDILGVGVDLSETDLRTAQEKMAPFQDYNPRAHFALQQADASRLPFADHSFDKIICSEVLEHIQDYESVLREIKRVLKPGGHLAISVPRAWPEKICWWLSTAYHQVPGGHVHIFNASQLRKEISLQGFKLMHRHWAHALHSPFWWLKCLWWNRQDNSTIIKLYHRLLVWDLMKKPWLTQRLEKILNPILGKSVVMYFVKSGDL